MGRKPTPREETDIERAFRVRDNKRRHRARQKEYVSDLERKVAETREHGIRVTKEVQLAAQRVMRENAKLRDLLKRTGYADDMIDAWLREEKCLDGMDPQLMSKSTLEKSAQKVASACEPQKVRELEAQNINVKEGKPVLMETSESGVCLTKSSPLVESRNRESEVSPIKMCGGSCTLTSPSQYSDSTGAPCKLLTLLAKNPAADITQVPLSKSEDQPSKPIEPNNFNSDGIECSTAYKMLMQYATSEEKMDRIATTLESGCVPSAAGGCKVKKSVIWKALDEECT